MNSILNSVKKLIGVAEHDNNFDTDLILHINSVFTDLNQLGAGPPEGFYIEDDTSVWTDFIPDIGKVENIKSYMVLRVRMLFDPPTSSAVIESINRQIEKLEWRINVSVDDGDSDTTS